MSETKTQTFEKKKSVEFMIRGIPRGLRDNFKALCAKKGVSMNQPLIDFIERAVSQNSLEKS